MYFFSSFLKGELLPHPRAATDRCQQDRRLLNRRAPGLLSFPGRAQLLALVHVSRRVPRLRQRQRWRRGRWRRGQRGRHPHLRQAIRSRQGPLHRRSLFPRRRRAGRRGGRSAMPTETSSWGLTRARRLKTFRLERASPAAHVMFCC